MKSSTLQEANKTVNAGGALGAGGFCELGFVTAVGIVQNEFGAGGAFCDPVHFSYSAPVP